MSFAYSYEDLAELIEDKGYEECVEGRGKNVVEELSRLCTFFENIENKNEEMVHYLADIYLLTGEFCQCSEMFTKSISWFEKAINVDKAYDVPYHSMALSFLNLGEVDKAISYLEQEIEVASGNYYTYLFLSDLYERSERYEAVEKILRDLLSRDPNNIQALHKLICHYQKRSPELDVELLRRRLINADNQRVKLDLVIWTYHMYCDNQYEEAIKLLNERESKVTGIAITHLLKAFLYGIMNQHVKKRNELKEFKKLNRGWEESMRIKLEEFSNVFGKKAGHQMLKKLSLIEITSR
jgi:tetratricopeptide (TPR) repeat protein